MEVGEASKARSGDINIEALKVDHRMILLCRELGSKAGKGLIKHLQDSVIMSQAAPSFEAFGISCRLLFPVDFWGVCGFLPGLGGVRSVDTARGASCSGSWS